MSHHSRTIPPPISSQDASSSSVGRWRTTAARALAGTAVALLAACGGDATAPLSPLGSPASGAANAASAQGGDPLARWLSNTPGSCLVSRRTADGRYPSQTVTVALPGGLASISVGTTRLAYRGWQAGMPEPVLLAVCTIPDVPGAREFLSARFGGKAMDRGGLRNFAIAAGVIDAEEWGPSSSPHIMPGAAPVYMIDGLASSFPALRATRLSMLSPTRGATMMVVCDDPTLPGCDPPPSDPPPPPPPPTCDPYVDLPAPGCEETIPDSPPPPEAPDFSVVPAPAGAPTTCEGRTDDPHLSTTPGFGGRINVKASNTCNGVAPQFVSVSLKRERCFLWVFCGWPTIATGSYSNTAAFVQAMANTDCVWRDGWYVGHGYHQTTFPQGIASTTTVGRARRIRC